VEATDEIIAIELLGSADYTEGDNPALVDHCTVLRSLGRFEVDPIVSVTADGGTAAMSYSAYICTIGETVLMNTLAAGQMAGLKPGNPLAPNRVGRVIQTFFSRAFTATVFTQGVTPTVFLPVSTGDEQRFAIEWDVTQKIKLKSDEALYLIATAQTVGTLGEGEDWAWFCNSRTLYAD